MLGLSVACSGAALLSPPSACYREATWSEWRASALLENERPVLSALRGGWNIKEPMLAVPPPSERGPAALVSHATHVWESAAVWVC